MVQGKCIIDSRRDLWVDAAQWGVVRENDEQDI
jgi:hypothetical protein